MDAPSCLPCTGTMLEWSLGPTILWGGLPWLMQVILEKSVYARYPQLLAVPISARTFGPNKKWRAFVIVPLTYLLSCQLLAAMESSLSIGAWSKYCHANVGLMCQLAMALATQLFELPNSALKRWMCLGPGKRPESAPARVAVFAMDHVDRYCFPAQQSPYAHSDTHFVRAQCGRSRGQCVRVRVHVRRAPLLHLLRGALHSYYDQHRRALSRAAALVLSPRPVNAATHA